MDIRSMAENMGKLDATNQSSEAAIADFILANLKVFSSKQNKKAFIVTAIQAYALLLQENEVKVVA